MLFLCVLLMSGICFARNETNDGSTSQPGKTCAGKDDELDLNVVDAVLFSSTAAGDGMKG